MRYFFESVGWVLLWPSIIGIIGLAAVAVNWFVHRNEPKTNDPDA